MGSGKITLLANNGQVVVDQEWDYANPASGIFFYYDLKNPSLSTNTWESIKSLLPGQTYTYSQEGYKIYASHLDEYDAQYYMVVFVLEREIFEPITAIQNENNEQVVTTTIWLVVICVALIVVITSVVVLLIRSILRTFKDVERNVTKFLRNIGDTTRSLGEGMADVNEGNARELSALQSGINTMIHTLQRQRNEDENGGGTVNVSKEGAPLQMEDLWNLIPMATTCSGGVGTILNGNDESDLSASAPPIVEAYLVQEAEVEGNIGASKSMYM